jgi:3-hydroxybutyryl-CoA dehydrogenase
MAVEVITVLGSGTMGLGIAQVGAMGGYKTFVYDLAQDQLDKARGIIEKNLAKGVEKGKVEQSVADTAIANLAYTTDFEAAATPSDLVIEAIPENIKLKLDTFSRLDELCKPTTVLASNTSALSITEIAGSTQRPDKVIGMHFFNPVHIMKLVEIIRGLETSDETYAITEAVSVKMGKQTVEVNESPGFVTSRINAMIGNEAFYMLQEGVASARDIDAALKLGLNHPMGPFELVDLVGLDTRLNILRFLHEKLGSKFRPCPLLEKYVKAGRLGRKVGKGVYEYE